LKGDKIKMKIKKLLSMGALGLVLTCSTSVGASAATIPNNTDIIQIFVNQYENGINPIGVLSGVNKDTKLGDVVNDDVLTEIGSELSNHPYVSIILDQIYRNKDNTIGTVLNQIFADEVTFSNYKSKFIEIAEKVQAMDAKVGVERIAAEQKAIDIVKAYNESFNVTFGKDSLGKTTASIEKDGQVLIQLNSDNLQTVIDRVKNLTWADVSVAKALAASGTIQTQTVDFDSVQSSVKSNKPTETTGNSKNGNGNGSLYGNSGSSNAALSQAIIDAHYKTDTKITKYIVKNADRTTTIKPTASFIPGTYNESITAAGKTYVVTKDVYITLNGKDAYISGNYKDGYKIDAGATGKIEISASISVYDSTNGKLYYVNPKNVETVTIPAN
jgi:hypothetical protein